MRVAVDTNILVRAIIEDDPVQTPLAQKALVEADLIALTTSALCEFVWVLHRAYRLPGPEMATAIRALLESSNVVTDFVSVEAGLAVLDAGGDFADGVIAFEGGRLGADAFLSFDRQAVMLIQAGGGQARLLG